MLGFVCSLLGVRARLGWGSEEAGHDLLGLAFKALGSPGLVGWPSFHPGSGALHLCLGW